MTCKCASGAARVSRRRRPGTNPRSPPARARAMRRRPPHRRAHRATAHDALPPHLPSVGCGPIGPPCARCPPRMLRVLVRQLSDYQSSSLISPRAAVVPAFTPHDHGARVRSTQDALAARERERLPARAGYPSAVLEIGAMLRAVLRVCHAVR